MKRIRGLRDRLARLLGPRYATVVDITDRAVAAFLLVVVSNGALDAANVFSTSAWDVVIRAATLAAASVVKSAVLAALTGSPALLSPVSTTLRARRDAPGRRPSHRVPVRRPAGRRHPSPHPRTP